MFYDALLLVLLVAAALFIASRYHRVEVAPTESVVLVRNGIERGLLGPGVHRFLFGTVELVRFEQRERRLRCAGQDVLSEDRVPIKVTVAYSFVITDALTAFRNVADFDTHVHAAVQLALREIVGARDLESLLADRAALSEPLVARLTEAFAFVGAELREAHVLDVGVGANLKQAFADVARAQAEGRAKLERARAEAAALRKLANAARLLRDHQGLERLKELEVAGRAADAHGNSLVMGIERIDAVGRARA